MAKNKLPPLSESIVRSGSTPQRFTRGHELYRAGAVDVNEASTVAKVGLNLDGNKFALEKWLAPLEETQGRDARRDEIERVMPENTDCRAAAEQQRVSLLTVADVVRRAAQSSPVPHAPIVPG